jgi:hypothetical protein
MDMEPCLSVKAVGITDREGLHPNEEEFDGAATPLTRP